METLNNSIFGKPSLGCHYRDAKNLALLLSNLKSGLSTFQKVQAALHKRHGDSFSNELRKEVARYDSRS